MKFQIEQVALCPVDPIKAKELLTAMGAGEWAEDHVIAAGKVYGNAGRNEADLSFDYEMLKGANELEVLHYTTPNNWMFGKNRVSHLGMHCSAEELLAWRGFFAERGIQVAQEVFTESHTNPHIAGKRSYNYVIFDTHDILSVDVKFIVRIDV